MQFYRYGWFLFAWAALAHFAIPAVAADAALLRAALESIRADQLKGHVDILADDSFEGREAGSRGGRATSVYLLKVMQKFALKPAGTDSYYQAFDAGYRNVLGMIQGSDPDLSQQVIVVGAHYDHVGYGTERNSNGPIGYIHNGADDNASGIAALVEMIEAFSLLPERPKRSILFAFWDGEEKGLLGSKHWAASPTVPLAKVPVAINVDMIGRLRNSRVEVLGTRTAAGLRQLVSRQNLTESLTVDFTWEMKDNSDHWSFVSRGVPVVMFHTGLHDDYHRPSDDAHKVNSQGMQEVAQLMFTVVAGLAEAPQLPAFRRAARYESPAGQQEYERPLVAAPPRLGVWWQVPSSGAPGLEVTRIQPGSPAAAAGLVVGDRLIKFQDIEVTSDEQLRALVVAAENAVGLAVVRPSEAEPKQFQAQLLGKPVRVGISWRETEAEPGAVTLVQVISGSPADRAGLKTGDRVYEVAGRTFRDGAELLSLLTAQPLPMELLVERRGRIKSVTLPDVPKAVSATSAE